MIQSPPPLPSWLPKRLIPHAQKVLTEAKDSIRRTKNILHNTQGIEWVKYWDERLTNERNKHLALLRLFADESGLEEIWHEIAENYPTKLNILPDEIIAGYDEWAARPRHTPHQHGIQMGAIIKQVEKLSRVLIAAPDIRPMIDRILKKKGVIESPDSSIMLLYKSIPILRESKDYLERVKHGLERPLYNDDFPTKINGKTAEEVYFTRVVARAIQKIYGAKEYAKVALILQQILDKPDGITENDVSKNVRAK